MSSIFELAVTVTVTTQLEQTIVKTSMEFNQDNKVIQLCAKGMELEGGGKREEASNHFKEAWNLATTDFEKFTAAHYVARHQPNISDKLTWDKEALKYALQTDDETPLSREFRRALWMFYNSQSLTG